MANRLKMTRVQALVALFEQGWSQRRIARELGIDRAAVARYLERWRALSAKPAIVHTGSNTGKTAKPAIVHTGSVPENVPKPANLQTGLAGQPDPKPAIVHTGSEAPPAPPAAVIGPQTGAPSAADPLADPVLADALLAGLPPLGLAGPAGSPGSPGRPSACAAFRDVIQAKVEQGLSAQRIWQDLREAHGFGHSYYSVLRFVRKLTPGTDLPFRRIEKAAGEEAQVDFGSGAPLIGPDGKRQRTHVFRIVLSHSRKAYSEAVTRQTTDAFLGALENAFQHFGGVPRTLVIDNLKAAVTRADWYDPEINPKVTAFCEHYGTVMLPTKPRMPRHKGKVERGIDYVQENALKGHRFTSLHEQNRFLLDWECHTADTRIHGTTRRQVGPHFASVEKPALLPLPAERFANFKEAQRCVHRDGHVEVERAYYSVPPEYLGRTVWARWDNRLVRVFNQRFELIATHIRHGPGGFSTQEAHLHAFKVSRVERGAQDLLARAAQLGTAIGQWAQVLHESRGVAGIRPLLGLLGLAKKFPVPILEDACAAASRHGAYRLRVVRQLAQRRLDEAQEQAPLLEAHPLIRPLAEYGQVARVAAWHPVLRGGGTSGPSFPRPPDPPSLFLFHADVDGATSPTVLDEPAPAAPPTQ